MNTQTTPAPPGHCQTCWDGNIAAPSRGPTCNHNRDWKWPKAKITESSEREITVVPERDASPEEVAEWAQWYAQWTGLDVICGAKTYYQDPGQL